MLELRRVGCGLKLAVGILELGMAFSAETMVKSRAYPPRAHRVGRSSTAL
jgi:hypothetical protein